MPIHPTAVVDKHAELDSTVEVGAFAVLGPLVKIGRGTRVGPHAVIEGDTTVGRDNQIFQFAAIGAIPQDQKYAGEHTRLVIGDQNQVRELTLEPGVQGGAFVDDTAEVHPTAAVSPSAYVGPGARIGARTTLHAGSRVLDCAVVGEGCTLWPGVVVRENCIVGNRVVLQPNAVVGSDGFGFAFDPEADGKGPMHRKVPQAGIVRIEDDVEVGACTCIDRATLGETVIGRGTKIDNLVQVAHNVKVGPLSLLVAQCGISGSTELGQGVILAGQVGVIGHLKLGDGARVGAQSGVSRDLEAGETVSGAPAIPHRDWLRLVAALPRVPELLREVRRLEKRIEELEKR